MDELQHVVAVLRGDASKLDFFVRMTKPHFSCDAAFYALLWMIDLELLPLDGDAPSCSSAAAANASPSVVAAMSRWNDAVERMKQVWASSSSSCPALHTASVAAQRQPRRKVFDDDDDDDANVMDAAQSAGASTSTEEVVASGDAPPPPTPTTTSLMDNPLLPCDGGDYATRFRARSLTTDITKDTDRLVNDAMAMAMTSEGKARIHQLLLRYCMDYNLEYRQGMHEVAAFVYHTCASSAEALSSMTLAADVDDDDDGDSVALLRVVREVVLPSGDVELLMPVMYSLLVQILQPCGYGLQDWFEECGMEDEFPTPESRRTVAAAAWMIQVELLRRVDAPLEHFLHHDLDLPRLCYLLRWLRLLFLREFSVAQSLQLWSILFADWRVQRLMAATTTENKDGDDDQFIGCRQSLVLYVAVSMLLHIKHLLCIPDEEDDHAIGYLMKYPPVDDLSVIVAKAFMLRRSYSMDDVPPPSPTTQASAEFSLHRHPCGASPSTSPAPHMDVKEMLMVQQGHALDDVVVEMESGYRALLQTHDPEDAALDVLLESIAKLKRIRDVLMQRVDAV